MGKVSGGGGRGGAAVRGGDAFGNYDADLPARREQGESTFATDVGRFLDGKRVVLDGIERRIEYVERHDNVVYPVRERRFVQEINAVPTAAGRNTERYIRQREEMRGGDWLSTLYDRNTESIDRLISIARKLNYRYGAGTRRYNRRINSGDVLDY